jgi:hypothetical protein
MNLDFLSAFANNPITLAILVIGAAVVVFITKGAPLLKEFRGANDSINEKVDTIIENDKRQNKDITEMKDHLRTNNLDVLRMTIYNEGIDIEDRLVAAKRYFVRGGNGKVAEYVHSLVEQHPSVWKIVLATTSQDKIALLPESLRSA